MALNNQQIWEAVRQFSPQFSARTSKYTLDNFNQKTFEAITDPSEIYQQFLGLTIRMSLQKIRDSGAIDPLLGGGFGETYSSMYGALIQRIVVNDVKAVNPKYKDLVQGGSVDPFVIVEVTQEEQIFQHNFEYQATVTIRGYDNFKQAFINPETGFASLIGAYMKALENEFTTTRYNAKLQAISKGITSTKYPLQETQKYVVPMADIPTTEQLSDFVLTVKDIVSAMTIAPKTSAFNAGGYSHHQDKDRLVLLVRKGIKNRTAVKLLANLYNADNLKIDIAQIELENFGGLKPFKEKAYTTPLYEVYNALGQVIGWAETADATVATIIDEKKVYWKDPTPNVVAIIADKGWLFETIQNPYTVDSIFNPRSVTQHLWARFQNNSINIDSKYNLVTISKVTP